MVGGAACVRAAPAWSHDALLRVSGLKAPARFHLGLVLPATPPRLRHGPVTHPLARCKSGVSSCLGDAGDGAAAAGAGAGAGSAAQQQAALEAIEDGAADDLFAFTWEEASNFAVVATHDAPDDDEEALGGAAQASAASAAAAVEARRLHTAAVPLARGAECAGVAWNKAFVRRLQAARSHEEVCDLVAAGAHDMDARSVSTALYAASTFVQPSSTSSGYWVPQAMASLFQPLLDRGRLGQMDATSLATTASALARLRHVDATTLDTLCGCAAAQLSHMSPRHLATLLWSLAKLQHPPPSSWLQSVLSACMPLLPLFSGQDLSNVLWALARLRFVPRHTWAAAFFAATVTRLDTLPPQALAVIAWALAVLRLQPPRPWLTAFLSASAPALRHTEPAGLAMTAYALMQLMGAGGGAGGGGAAGQQRGGRPPRRWLQALLAASQAALQRQQGRPPRSSSSVPGGGGGGGSSCDMSSQDLALLAMALDTWGVDPGPTWARLFVVVTGGSAAAMASFTAAGLPMVLSHAVGLGIRPPRSWMERWEEAAAAKLAAFSPAGLCDAVSGLAAVGHAPRPNSALAGQLLQLLGSHAPVLTVSQLGGVMHGCAKLGLRPPPCLMDRLMELSRGRLGGSSSPRAAAWLLLACASWSVLPGRGWMDAYWAAAARQLQQGSCSAKELVMLLQPAAALSSGSSSSSSSSSSSTSGFPAQTFHLLPPAAFMSAHYYPAAAALLPALRLEDQLTAVLTDLITLQQQPPTNWLQAVGHALMGRQLARAAQSPRGVLAWCRAARALAQLGFFRLTADGDGGSGSVSSSKERCSGLYAAADELLLLSVSAQFAADGSSGRCWRSALLELASTLPLLPHGPSPAWLGFLLSTACLPDHLRRFSAAQLVDLLEAVAVSLKATDAAGGGGGAAEAADNAWAQVPAVPTGAAAATATAPTTTAGCLQQLVDCAVQHVARLQPGQTSRLLAALAALPPGARCLLRPDQLACVVDVVERHLGDWGHREAVVALTACCQLTEPPSLLQSAAAVTAAAGEANAMGAAAWDTQRAMLRHLLLSAATRTPLPASAAVLLDMLATLHRVPGCTPSQEWLLQHSAACNQPSVWRTFSRAELEQLDALYRHFRFEIGVSLPLTAAKVAPMPLLSPDSASSSAATSALFQQQPAATAPRTAPAVDL